MTQEMTQEMTQGEDRVRPAAAGGSLEKGVALLQSKIIKESEGERI